VKSSVTAGAYRDQVFGSVVSELASRLNVFKVPQFWQRQLSLIRTCLQRALYASGCNREKVIWTKAGHGSGRAIAAQESLDSPHDKRMVTGLPSGPLAGWNSILQFAGVQIPDAITLQSTRTVARILGTMRSRPNSSLLLSGNEHKTFAEER
jgi:hypothetical protein